MGKRVRDEDDTNISKNNENIKKKINKELPIHGRILAPMVGGSELAFRLLCRKYGAQLCYTPMMSSERFASDSDYRKEQFQTCSKDRPLVAHFSANNPEILLKASLLIQNDCDAIDINLGCPQRIAHAGHFGSYLMDPKDRHIILSMVRKLSQNLTIPVFVKIRIYEDIKDTIEYCQQLEKAGASLIAIHARHRVNLVGRSGPGARDGPAILDQVRIVKEHVSIPVISNGNVITWEDVVKNASFTNADGVMSAEGLLDDPMLFYPAMSIDNKRAVSVLRTCKKLKKIAKLEKKSKINESERIKIERKKELEEKLQSLRLPIFHDCENCDIPEKPSKLSLAKEYLKLVQKYPVPMKTIVFHVRRMCKAEIAKYQMLAEILGAQTLDEILVHVKQMMHYEKHGNFVFDEDKERKAAEALKRKIFEEGRRKRFEERMQRKAKREGKPLDHYLNMGNQVPTVTLLEKLKTLPEAERMEIWRRDHSQHCLNFHLGQCVRDRTCAFLHTDAIGSGSANDELPSWLEECGE